MFCHLEKCLQLSLSQCEIAKIEIKSPKKRFKNNAEKENKKKCPVRILLLEKVNCGRSVVNIKKSMDTVYSSSV